jgi:hypothetical protein
VALEADTLYIKVGKNQILGRPFLPCSLLVGDYVTELLAKAKELVDWQTQFLDIICFDGKTTLACLYEPLEESGGDCWPPHQRTPRFLLIKAREFKQLLTLLI